VASSNIESSLVRGDEFVLKLHETMEMNSTISMILSADDALPSKSKYKSVNLLWIEVW